MTAAELATKLEAWAEERREAAIYHENAGSLAVSRNCEAQEDLLRQAAARLRAMEEALERIAARYENPALPVTDEIVSPHDIRAAVNELAQIARAALAKEGE